MSKRLLCVWLPNWPVQRVQADQPQLASAPLILSTRDPRRGMIVVAANLQAREQGIRPTMRLTEATTLVDSHYHSKQHRSNPQLTDTCQPPTILEFDDEENWEALSGLAEQAQQFSPVVGIEVLDQALWVGRTFHRPEALFLDITGVASLFGGEIALVNQVAQWLHQQKYFACMGIAGTLGAAWALANYATRKPKFVHRIPQTAEVTQVEQTDDNSVSRDTSTDLGEVNPPFDYRLPDSRYCIAQENHDAEVVAQLPIAAMRLPEETHSSLQRLGIHTVEQLDALPRDGLATRLGEQLISRWDQARGTKDEPIVALHSQPDWCLEQTLEYPTTDRETIAELVKQLCMELSQRLKKRGEGALRIVCRLDLLQKQPLVMQLGLFRPTHEATHLQLLLTGQLEQQLRSAGETPLWRLSLQATLTAPMAWRQGELFEGGDLANRNQIARLVDTLSSRLGRQQVLTASAKRDAQPELAYNLKPLTGRRPDGTQESTVKKLSTRLARRRAEPARTDPLRRPTHLLPTPQAIQIRMDASQTPAANPNSQPSNQENASVAQHQGMRFAGAPNQIHHQGQWKQVQDARGPERLESGWWRTTRSASQGAISTRRDYYRITLENGSCWWIFRDLTNGKWYLHGIMD